MQKAWGNLRKPNSIVDQRIHSSAQVLRCSAINEQSEGELQHEIAVARDVEAVGRHALEPQPLGDVDAIDRQAGAGQGRRAQAQHVGPPAAVGQPVPVALELLAVGQPVVRRQDRLRPLHMGVAGQDHVEIGVAAADERSLEIDEPQVDLVDGLADPEPQVGGHLVVAAAGGVQFAADVAEPVDQRPLDVHVDVFQGRRERESALLNLLADVRRSPCSICRHSSPLISPTAASIWA